MGHQIAKLALAPILFAQGRYVRRTVPRLPEAAGPRDGGAGSGRSLRLLIVGDSAAAGVGAATQSEALAGRLAATLAAEFSVRWTLIATTGWTTRCATDALLQIPAAPFDVVVTSLGVNDVTAGRRLQTWLRDQRELVAVLRCKFSAGRILLSALPPMHRFRALPQPLRWYLGAQARSLDQALRGWVESQRDCDHVAPGFGLDPNLMATDGFHPGPEAYRLWSDTLAAHIRDGWPSRAAPRSSPGISTSGNQTGVSRMP